MGFLFNFFTNLAHQYGVLGVGIGMAMESLGVPFASIVIDVATVPLVQQGKISYIGLIMVATIGATIGSVASYFMGYFLGDLIRKFRKGKLVRQEEKLNDFIAKYGDYSIFFAQLFGATRSFISLPAGLVKFKFSHFLLGTFFGTLTINTLLILLAPYMYRIWIDISNYLGLPIWISIILMTVFVLEIAHLYRVTVKTIKENNGNNPDFIPEG